MLNGSTTTISVLVIRFTIVSHNSYYFLLFRNPVQTIAKTDGPYEVPPSKVTKVTLQFEKEDGGRFNLSVSSDIKIEQLKREICIEEKIDAKQLKVIATQEDSHGDEVVTLKELDDDDVLSTLSLEDEVICCLQYVSEILGLPSKLNVP
jgi:hypothetical protein